jgi:protein SCO1/2
VTAAAVWAQGQPQAQVSNMRGDKPVPLPPALVGVGIQQKLGAQLPMDALFRDEAGRLAPLSAYFGNKPVLLALVYYECPMLCTQILNGMEMSLKAIPFTPGKEFEVVAISFNPKDTPELAAAKKINYVRRYGLPETAAGWHFLTGDETSIKAVTEAAGFHYRWDAANQQFAHASAIYIATPDGRMSRYFYGVEYAPKDIRLGLVDASSGKIGSVVDEALLFCYHYDPYTAKYTAIAMNIVRLGGVIFVLLGSTFLFFMWRRDWRRDRNAKSGIPEVKRA